MPVTGLPATVEKTLTALLSENSVSSWKITGQGDSTVFVLRFKPASEMSTNMADRVLNQHTQVQYYRRKPPSQIRRDQQRAKQQQQQQQQQQRQQQPRLQQVSEGGRTPDVNKLFVSDTLHSTQDDVDQHASTPAHLDHSDTDSECGADLYEANLQLPHIEPDPPIDSVIAGFEASAVKNYVATLTDRSVQNRLRRKDRNKLFRKVVLHRSDDADVLLCESDDIVLEYSCDIESGGWVYWYVKQERKKMLTEECVRLANLRKGTHVRNTKYAETEARALRQLHALHDIICFYLG